MSSRSFIFLASSDFWLVIRRVSGAFEMEDRILSVITVGVQSIGYGNLNREGENGHRWGHLNSIVRIMSLRMKEFSLKCEIGPVMIYKGYCCLSWAVFHYIARAVFFRTQLCLTSHLNIVLAVWNQSVMSQFQVYHLWHFTVSWYRLARGLPSFVVVAFRSRRLR